jgi:hypothetical protein
MFFKIALFVAGVIIAGLTLRDVFQTVIVPGESRSSLQVARRLIYLLLPVWKLGRGRLRGLSGTFAPSVLVLSFVVWMAFLMIGFALMAWAARERFEPLLASYWEALYVAGTSMVTVGPGSNEKALGIARWVILGGGFAGFAVVTMAVTYLLQVQGNVTRRDTGIIKLTTVAGSPPSAVTLLKRFAAIHNQHELEQVVSSGRDWCAAVRQSHVSHPTLIYFQSVGSDAGWPAALGAILDLSLLIQFFIDDDRLYGPSVLLRQEGERMARELAMSARVKPQETKPDEAILVQAQEQLAAAGYRLRPDPDTATIAGYRAEYRACIQALAEHLGKPTGELVRQE